MGESSTHMSTPKTKSFRRHFKKHLQRTTKALYRCKESNLQHHLQKTKVGLQMN